MTAPARPGAPRPRAEPGDLLLGLVPLAAVALLIVNDHLLKATWPGPVTGKLSDAAGLVFFPFLSVGAWELLTRRRTGVRALVVSVAVTGIAFALVKATEPGAEAFRVGLGLVQWPVGAAASLLTGVAVPHPGRVAFVADPTDLAMLPALAAPLALGVARRWDGRTFGTGGRSIGRLGANPEDLAVASLGVAMLGGAVIDGWAHVHLPGALETILTPWHAIVYTAFALLVAVIAGGMAARAGGVWRDRPPGARRDVAELIPLGYGTTVVGVGVFLAAGLADTVWHIVFGLEADAEALVSPTHLLLGVGAGLVASGPIRAAWLAQVPARWAALAPAVLAIGTITGLLAFATHLAHPLVDPWPAYPYHPGSASYSWVASLGIASAGLQAVIVAAGLAALVRLWPAVPPGALALVVVISTGPLVFLHDQARFLVAVAAGAVAVELARHASSRAPVRARVVSIAVSAPAIVWVAEVAVLGLARQVLWSAHLIGGALVVVVVAAAGVGLLATLPGTDAGEGS